MGKNNKKYIKAENFEALKELLQIKKKMIEIKEDLDKAKEKAIEIDKNKPIIQN